MSQGQQSFEQLMGSVMQGMTLHLLEIATGDDGPKEFQTCNSGGLVHLRVKNGKGEVCLQVAGKNMSDLGWQLVLTCFHNISIEDLRGLHKCPLKRALQVKKGKK